MFTVYVDMFDRSFCIKPIYPPNGIKPMELYIEAFNKVFDNLDEAKVEKHLDAIAKAKCIQVFGIGRMKCAVRAFVMFSVIIPDKNKREESLL